MEGNLSPVEKFIATASDGKQMLREARTQWVKDIYRNHPAGRDGGAARRAGYVELFVDIDIDKDFGMSIFVFDEDIERKFGSSR